MPCNEKVIDDRLDRPENLRDRLSPRQREVLDGILAGNPNKVIAQKLTLSTRTVEAHRAAIMSKLGVSSVAELVRATVLFSDSIDSLTMMSRIYPGLVSFWDNALIARFANDLHESAFGTRVQDILGQSMAQLFGASCVRQSMPFIRGVLGGKTQHFRQVVQTPGGRPMTFYSVYAPQFDGLGKVEGFFAFMIDGREVPEEAGSMDAQQPIADEDG